MNTNPHYSRQMICLESSGLSYEVTYDVSFTHGGGITCWMWLSEDCKYRFSYLPDEIKQFMDKNGSAVLT